MEPVLHSGMPKTGKIYMETRECPFCGKSVSACVTQCAYCREELPPAFRPKSAPDAGGDTQIRRGLLFMLVAAVIGYFAGGYSPLLRPVATLSMASNYLSPLLFLSGLALAVHGHYLQHKAMHRNSA
jgi:hypothetical protein